VDFRTPLLEANWLVLGSNCSRVGVVPSGSGGVFPSGTGVAFTATRGVFPTPVSGHHGKKGSEKRSGLRLRG